MRFPCKTESVLWQLVTPSPNVVSSPSPTVVTSELPVYLARVFSLLRGCCIDLVATESEIRRWPGLANLFSSTPLCFPTPICISLLSCDELNVLASKLNLTEDNYPPNKQETCVSLQTRDRSVFRARTEF